MKLGSLFDGSGTCPLAATLCGIDPVWASEIEPYPIRVTQKNFPQMKHLGDITRIKGDEIEPVDIITFGSPCQDLSVAGKRAGIHEGERSSLFFEAIRVIREMREKTHGRCPTIAVWENVPGAFSSNRGRDFLAVLQAFVKVAGGGCDVPEPVIKQGKLQWSKDGCVMGDGFSLAWRMLDAQYWGVPQRRKRIYLVADFAGRRAGEILFEREGLSGNYAESGTSWERITADAARSAGGSDSVRCLNPWDYQSKRIYQPDGVCPTLPAMDCSGTNNQAVLYALDSMSSNSMKSSNPHSGFHAETVAKTLQAGGVDPTCNQGGNVIVEPIYALQGNGIARGQNVVCYDARGNGDGAHCPTLTGDHENRVTDYTAVCVMAHGQSNAEVTENISPALNCNHEQPIAAYSVDCRNGALDKEKTHTLQAKASGGQSLNCTPSVLMPGKPPRKYIIRRLTPLECCRLQGFPDWWEEGEEGSDTARYKMWGNGMALPCVLYVMQGIANIEKEEV